MKHQIFINIPVTKLNNSVKFFSKLGFKFNKQFTNKTAACMIISENIFAMLVIKKRFKTFTKKKVAPSSVTEAILAISMPSKKSVDELTRKAFAAGAKKANKPYDIGFMYGTSFFDIDGHMWELFWMDPKFVKKQKK